MSQSKQIKAKTLINFCGGDFLKFSKHRIFDKKKGKKILDKTNSFTNSNCYNDNNTKAETIVEEDKDKLILKLNQRIIELESRINYLETSNNKRKESINQTPKSSKYLAVSNSEVDFKTTKKNSLLYQKALTQSINSPNKSLQEKCFDRLKIHQLLNVKPFKKSTIKSQSVKLSIKQPYTNNYFASSVINTEQSIEPKCKDVIQNNYQQNNNIKLKREQSLDNIDSKYKVNAYMKNKMMFSNTPGCVNNTKAIPKIPRNRNGLFKSNTITTGNNSITSLPTIKDQLNEIRLRTHNVFNELIDMSNANNIVKHNNDNEQDYCINYNEKK